VISYQPWEKRTRGEFGTEKGRNEHFPRGSHHRGDGAGKGPGVQPKVETVPICGSSYSISSARLDECGIIGNA
jgi:hypothetical protein